MDSQDHAMKKKPYKVSVNCKSFITSDREKYYVNLV